MKFTLTIGLVLCLIFTVSAMASAEVLFGVSGAIGQADITADYASLTDVSDISSQLMLDADLNLLGTHVNLRYGLADLDHATFSTIDFRVGWQLGLDILKVKAFGGYQYYLFSDDSLSAHQDSKFMSLVGGLGFESKIDKVTLYGSTMIPLATRFKNGHHKDNDADLCSIEAGIAYAPMPFVDLFLNYRYLSVESDQFLDLDSRSYTVGVKVSF